MKIRCFLFGLVSACFWGATSTGIAAVIQGHRVTYTDLSPAPARHGELNFTTDSQQGGAMEGLATIWNGPSPSPVNLHPSHTAALFSLLMGGAGNQQVGYTYRESWGGPRAALWTGSAASQVSLHPAWALSSTAYAATETHQAGSVTMTPTFQVRAGFWSGTAASFVDLHPGGVSSEAYAMAGNQQGGMVNYNGTAQAALWSGTAASYLNLHPLGSLEHSRILGMTTNQQVGYAGDHAGLWFGSAGTFQNLHPAGAGFSEARATVEAIQAGYATFAFQPHAILWFGSATNYLNLHPVMGAGYRHSEARSVWTDGTTTLVAGMARTTTGISHAILWRVTALPAPSVVCSPPLILEYTNGVATGVLHAQVEDANGSTVVVVWTVDGIPMQTNTIPSGGNITQSNLTFRANYEAGVHVISAIASHGGTNRATCSTTVTVLGPLSIKQIVLQELEAADAGQEGERIRALRRAMARLRRSISEEWWADGAHLHKSKGGFVFRNEALTALHLKTLLRTTRDEIPDAVVQAWISRLVEVDRTLALLQINEARAAGAGPKQVALATRRVARGDRLANRGRPVQAILLYRQAWRMAAHHQ